MDPQATWQRLLESYRHAHWEEAEQAAPDLLDWLGAGGFPPQTQSALPMSDAWNRALTQAACRLVLRQCGSERH